MCWSRSVGVICTDTSVLIPVIAEWHVSHDVARSALDGPATTVGHCVLEAYSVLTRLPQPEQVDPAVAVAALDRLVGAVIVLDNELARRLPGELQRRGVAGGPCYDGLIALTAAHHRATLLTMDSRAARTYHACGVDFELLSA